jgi:hypothetical protein
LNGDRWYIDRIWEELEGGAAYPDWSPEHFLDTAQMTCSYAMAYDWLYHEWSERQRAVIREAIITHGLHPAMDVYGSEDGFHRKTNNWNQVCNGGVGIGALAIADQDPELATSVISEGFKTLPISMSMYGPDGAGLLEFRNTLLCSLSVRTRDGSGH